MVLRWCCEGFQGELLPTGQTDTPRRMGSEMAEAPKKKPLLLDSTNIKQS